MNLFRSEEHVRNWSGFKSGTEEGIVELSVLAKLFSVYIFTRRLDPDYVSHFQSIETASIASPRRDSEKESVLVTQSPITVPD